MCRHSDTKQYFESEKKEARTVFYIFFTFSWRIDASVNHISGFSSIFAANIRSRLFSANDKCKPGFTKNGMASSSGGVAGRKYGGTRLVKTLTLFSPLLSLWNLAECLDIWTSREVVYNSRSTVYPTRETVSTARQLRNLGKLSSEIDIYTPADFFARNSILNNFHLKKFSP